MMEILAQKSSRNLEIETLAFTPFPATGTKLLVSKMSCVEGTKGGLYLLKRISCKGMDPRKGAESESDPLCVLLCMKPLPCRMDIRVGSEAQLVR